MVLMCVYCIPRVLPTLIKSPDTGYASLTLPTSPRLAGWSALVRVASLVGPVLPWSIFVKQLSHWLVRNLISSEAWHEKKHYPRRTSWMQYSTPGCADQPHTKELCQPRLLQSTKTSRRSCSPVLLLLLLMSLWCIPQGAFASACIFSIHQTWGPVCKTHEALPCSPSIIPDS